MFVEWKNERVKVIPLTASARKASSKNDSSLILLPGVNDIEDAVWKVVKEYKTIAMSIKSRALIERVIEEKKGNGQKKEITKFVDLSQEDAEALVKETVNLKTLKQWKKEDRRSDVRVAIEDRIKEIKSYNSKDTNMANQG